MKLSSIKCEVFEAKDFEDAYLKWLVKKGETPKKVPISEMEFELIDFVPDYPSSTPAGMGFAITVDGRRIYDFELFSDDETELFYLPNGECLGDEFWGVNIKDYSKLFDFDVSQFKSFQRWTDSSD